LDLGYAGGAAAIPVVDETTGCDPFMGLMCFLPVFGMGLLVRQLPRQ